MVSDTRVRCRRGRVEIITRDGKHNIIVTSAVPMTSGGCKRFLQQEGRGGRHTHGKQYFHYCFGDLVVVETNSRYRNTSKVAAARGDRTSVLVGRRREAISFVGAMEDLRAASHHQDRRDVVGLLDCSW